LLRLRNNPARAPTPPAHREESHVMTDFTVSTGITSTGLTVSSGDTWSIYGTAISFTVVDGGTETVSSGGTASVTSLTGGSLHIASDGTAISTTLSDASATVDAGGTISFTTLDSGGYVFGNGTAISTTANDGSFDNVQDGGTASFTTVHHGGSEEVANGGLAVDTVVSSGGYDAVYAGGSASFTTVSNLGIEYVGQETIADGITVSTMVDAGGTQEVYFSGIASFTTVSSGGYQKVSSGGVAIDTTVLDGGFAIVSSGGTETVASGTATGVTLSGGGETVDASGTAISTTVNAGPSASDFGVITVDAGGTISFTTLNSGSYIFGNGTAVSTTANDGSFDNVQNGGTASFTTVRHGGSEEVANGGLAVDTVVSSGGYDAVYAGGSASFTTVSNHGVEYVGEETFADGITVSTMVDSGGAQIVYFSGIASDTTVSSGGFQYVSSGGMATNTVVDSGGAEILSTGGSATSTTVSSGGTIDVTHLAYVSSATVTANPVTDVLSFTEGAQSYTQQLAGSYTGEYFHLSPDSGTGTLVTVNDTPCYCRGTRILTDRGEVPVEDLRIGDRIVTFSGATRPIDWIGRRHIDLGRHPAPELVQPIRIRADAVADGVPRRDLRVSPDHAILLDGGLIPVRLLVNGASIERETHCAAVTYYHVELETHDILLAEALPAESYLDTGNRGMFENADGPLTLHPDFSNDQRLRIAGSYRPFIDAPARVAPIWHRLAARATRLGFALPAQVETTFDPGLCVIGGNRTFHPVSRQPGCHSFVLPRSAGPIELVSRAARPCDLRPWVEDRRRLGVMVSRLTLRSGQEAMTIPLDHPRLTHGWWDLERDGVTAWRWTDGHALIELSDSGPVTLEVTFAGGLEYPIGPTHAPGSHGDAPAEACQVGNSHRRP
jgi:autotransporter passenger strand-loop-strand repeat protein